MGTALTEIRHIRANRQYVAMDDGELWGFLDSMEKLYVAFPMENGYPHVSPVWFCILSKKLYVRTHDYKVKTRLARIGKVCCTTDEGRKYNELRGVVVWGHCRVMTDSKLIERVEKIMEIKYKEQQWRSPEMPAWWVQERKAEKRAYIEILPVKFSSWDNRRIKQPP